jgi:uncharacterized protein
MSGGLPEYLDLTRAGRAPLNLAGSLSLSRMPRLCAALADSSGEAGIDLRVFEEGGLKVVQGSLRADLGLSCQRCFTPLLYPAIAEIRLAWARSPQEAEQLPSTYEALVSASGRVKLAELIEDELLLALPLVARHATTGDCRAPRVAIQSKRSEMATKVSNPFAALKMRRRR